MCTGCPGVRVPTPLIDSHCHFDATRFDDDRETVFQRARQAGVAAQIVPSVSADSWPAVRRVCGDYPGLYPAYGLHPMFMSLHHETHLEDLAGWLQRERPVAVGECGLDYAQGHAEPARQQHFFAAQLALARQFDLPVIVHARRSVEAAIQLVRKHPGVRGVFHSFSGSEPQARLLIDLGFLLGFGGPITYPGATRLRRLVTRLPLEALLLESDAPDQPDVDQRGKRNEPSRVARVLAELAQLRDEPEAAIAARCLANARQLFSLAEVA